MLKIKKQTVLMRLFRTDRKIKFLPQKTMMPIRDLSARDHTAHAGEHGGPVRKYQDTNISFRIQAGKQLPVQFFRLPDMKISIRAGKEFSACVLRDFKAGRQGAG